LLRIARRRAFIVTFYDVWHGMPMMVTLIGWGLVAKSTLYFVYPRHGLRMLGTIFNEEIVAFCSGGRVECRGQRFDSVFGHVKSTRSGDLKSPTKQNGGFKSPLLVPCEKQTRTLAEGR
jgi:hypothetical protein